VIHVTITTLLAALNAGDDYNTTADATSIDGIVGTSGTWALSTVADATMTKSSASGIHYVYLSDASQAGTATGTLTFTSASPVYPCRVRFDAYVSSDSNDQVQFWVGDAASPVKAGVQRLNGKITIQNGATTATGANWTLSTWFTFEIEILTASLYRVYVDGSMVTISGVSEFTPFAAFTTMPANLRFNGPATSTGTITARLTDIHCDWIQPTFENEHESATTRYPGDVIRPSQGTIVLGNGSVEHTSAGLVEHVREYRARVLVKTAAQFDVVVAQLVAYKTTHYPVRFSYVNEGYEPTAEYYIYTLSIIETTIE
jgi:hypothetical protein